MLRRLPICTTLAVLGVGSATAQQQGDGVAQLAGTWKLISAVMEDVDTREQKLVWGEHPNGYIVLTPAGRWIVVQTAEEGFGVPAASRRCGRCLRQDGCRREAVASWMGTLLSLEHQRWCLTMSVSMAVTFK